jgi:hypothetical protein
MFNFEFAPGKNKRRDVSRMQALPGARAKQSSRAVAEREGHSFAFRQKGDSSIKTTKRVALLSFVFMHVVIPKPPNTFGRHAIGSA